MFFYFTLIFFIFLFFEFYPNKWIGVCITITSILILPYVIYLTIRLFYEILYFFINHFTTILITKFNPDWLYALLDFYIQFFLLIIIVYFIQLVFVELGKDRSCLLELFGSLFLTLLIFLLFCFFNYYSVVYLITNCKYLVHTTKIFYPFIFLFIFLINYYLIKLFYLALDFSQETELYLYNIFSFLQKNTLLLLKIVLNVIKILIKASFIIFVIFYFSKYF